MATRTWIGGTSSAFATSSNWSPATTPVNGDDVIFDHNATGAIAGSDQSAITLNSLTVTARFGQGNAAAIVAGTNGTPLKIGVTNGNPVLINSPAGSGTASGSQRLNFDFAATAPLITIFTTSTTALDAGKEVVRIRTNNSAADINVISGVVGIATDNAGDTTTVGKVNVAGGSLNMGSGVTYTTLTAGGGACVVRSAPSTSIVANGGDVTSIGTYAIPLLTIDGGKHHLLSRASSGASITTCNLQGSGTLDTSQSGEAATVTTLNFRNGTIQAFSNTQLTFTNVSLDFDDSKQFSGGKQ